MAIVDVSFRLHGELVPQDHGYLLYAALSRCVPALHGAGWIAVHPIGGVTRADRMLQLRERSELRLRLPAEHIPTVLPLVGAGLDLAGHSVSLGVPTIHPLVPSTALDARVVLIKLTDVPARTVEGEDAALDIEAMMRGFSVEIERQLGKLNVRKPFALLGKQRVTVGGKVLIGFSVRVHDLTADESLCVLQHGVGGKRRMGCGVFRPTRGT